MNAVVSKRKWLEARKELLEEEKQHCKATAQLAEKRRKLPWVEVDKEYVLHSADGGADVKLADLFTHGDQLVVQHQMFGADWDEACKMCSAWTTQYSAILELIQKRTAFAVVASAAPEKLGAFRKLKGWLGLPYYSSAGSSFNADFGVGFTPEQVASKEKLYNFGKSAAFMEELMGFSVFKLVKGKVFHTYSTYAAGLSELSAPLKLFDILPDGRAEARNLDWIS